MFRHASRNAIELCQPMRRFRHGLFIASTDGEETNMTPRLESVVEHWTPKSLRIKAPLVRTFNERENRGCCAVRNQTRRRKFKPLVLILFLCQHRVYPFTASAVVKG